MTTTIDSRRTLLPFVLTVIALAIAVQVVVALDGGRIGLPAAVATVVLALYYAWFLIARRHELRRLRFGPYLAHAATFAVVITSFHLHLFVRASTGEWARTGFPLDEGWFGAVVAMTALWGLGLLLHTVSAISQRGFEDRP